MGFSCSAGSGGVPSPRGGASDGALPQALLPALVEAVGRDAGATYQAAPAQGDYRAANPAQGWQVLFAAAGVQVGAAGQEASSGLKLKLSRFGVDDVGQRWPVVGRTVAGNRVTYHRGILDEWYVNGPIGLEQGFTVRAPPRPGAEALVLELALGTGWRAEPEDQGLRLVGGEEVLHYGALHAVDAEGRTLLGQLSVADGRVSLQVADGCRLPGDYRPVTHSAGQAHRPRLRGL